MTQSILNPQSFPKPNQVVLMPVKAEAASNCGTEIPPITNKGWSCVLSAKGEN